MPGCCFGDPNLELFDKELKTIKEISVPRPNGFLFTFHCIKFNPANDNEFFYLTANAIYKMNISTGENSLVKTGCPDKKIIAFVISPDGKNIVAELELWNPISARSYTRLMSINLRDNSTKLINGMLE